MSETSDKSTEDSAVLDEDLTSGSKLLNEDLKGEFELQSQSHFGRKEDEPTQSNTTSDVTSTNTNTNTKEKEKEKQSDEGAEGGSGSNNNDNANTETFQSRIKYIINFIANTRIYTPNCVKEVLEQIIETLYQLIPLSPPPGNLDLEMERIEKLRPRGRQPHYIANCSCSNSPQIGVLSKLMADGESITSSSTYGGYVPDSSLRIQGSELRPRAWKSNFLPQNIDEVLKNYTVSELNLPNALKWNFDIIGLEKLTNFRPLTCIGMKIFPLFDAESILGVNLDILKNWLILVEANYHYTNPYHNATHAADVLQATAYYLQSERLQNFLDPVDKLTSLLAAIVHDVDHPGKTNAFLANCKHELALMYNDKGILENHHAAFAFRLTLSDPRLNIFQNVRTHLYKTMRASMVDMILATEMIHHHMHVNNFLNALKTCPEILSNKDVDIGLFKTKENLVLTKRIIIKCADVSNPARPLRVTAEWTRRISEEFFRQTDEELSLGLPLTLPSFNRATCSIPTAQRGFNDFFINNLFAPFAEFAHLPELTHHLRENYEFWKELENREICTTEQVNEYFDKTVIGEDPTL